MLPLDIYLPWLLPKFQLETFWDGWDICRFSQKNWEFKWFHGKIGIVKLSGGGDGGRLFWHIEKCFQFVYITNLPNISNKCQILCILRSFLVWFHTSVQDASMENLRHKYYGLSSLNIWLNYLSIFAWNLNLFLRLQKKWRLI